MSTINNGGPAFPVYDHHAHGQQFLADAGMTLRDYFAAKAMQALIGGRSWSHIGEGVDLMGVWAAAAFKMSDAMLKAREAQS